MFKPETSKRGRGGWGLVGCRQARGDNWPEKWGIEKLQNWGNCSTMGFKCSLFKQRLLNCNKEAHDREVRDNFYDQGQSFLDE